MAKKLTKDQLNTICFWKAASEIAETNKEAFESLADHKEIDRKLKAEFHKRWDHLDDNQKESVIIEEKRLNDAFAKKEAKKKKK